MLGMFFAAFAAGFEMGSKFSDGFGERVDSLVFGSDSANYRRMPAVARHHQRKHGMKLFFQAVGALAIGFVQHKNIANLHQAGLHVLNVGAEARHQNHDLAIGKPDDVNFVLADANGFNQDLPLAGRVQEQRDFGGGSSESAQKSARGHGSDKDSRVAGRRPQSESVRPNSLAA